MPSPFPGMDPYLENPAVFPGVHNRFIAVLSEVLRQVLPAPYFAEIGERVWVEVSQRFIEPDTSVLVREPGRIDTGGAVATASTRSSPVVVTVPHDERHEPYLEIRTVGNGLERLVTAIEVLSPSNKTPGERGRELYLRKQKEVLDSPAHLVEIDLLRGGVHSTAVPFNRLTEMVGHFDYHVSIHRSNRFEEFQVYPIRLDEPLPEIGIPLIFGDPDAIVDLQSIFHRVYDTGPYHRRISYRESTPVPVLRPEQKEWATQLLENFR